MNISETLAKIQASLKVPKSQRNKFGDFNYRSCEDILEAVKPIMKQSNCCLVLSDSIELIGDRYYVKAVAVLRSSDGEVSNSAYAREELVKKGMDGSQITGAASSYARKYALNGLFAIDDTADADCYEDTQAEEVTKKAVKAPPAEEAKKAVKTPPVAKEYICSVCGERIPKEYYEQSTAKYGVALCSKECRDIFLNKEN